jgi:RNA polymerase sigma factor (sigma-70 family)
MNVTGPDDAALVAGCLSGKKDAWDAFVGRFSKLVFWSVRKTLASTAYMARQDVCEDVYQDIFRKLLEPEGLARLRDVKGLRSFLTVMACHATLDKVKALSRSEKRTVSDFHEDGEEAPDASAFFKDGSPGPAETASAKERAALVAQALGTLPAKDKACVEFHYLDGKTHREIAEILGMPQDTVSTVIRRAREKLKDKLAERGLDS